MQRKAAAQTLRALAALMLRHLLKPVIILTTMLAIVGFTVMGLLTYFFSSWWLLLLVILVPTVIFVLLIGLLVKFLLQMLMPNGVTSEDKERLRTYMLRVIAVFEQVRMPYPVIFFLVIKDIVLRNDNKFLRSTIGESRELLKEFNELTKTFEK